MSDALTVTDYEEVLADHRRLVRELDVALNGDGAAKQASLCDLVAQVRALAKLPCDVRVAPATIIRKGCSLSTLLVSIEQRRKLPDDDPALRFVDPGPRTNLPGQDVCELKR